MFEFWSTMSFRVEQRSSTTVCSGSLGHAECLSYHVIDLNPVWDQIIYIPGTSSLHYS